MTRRVERFPKDAQDVVEFLETLTGEYKGKAL